MPVKPPAVSAAWQQNDWGYEMKKRWHFYFLLSLLILMCLAVVGYGLLDIDTQRLATLTAALNIVVLIRYSMFILLFCSWHVFIKTLARWQQWSEALTDYLISLRWYALGFVLIVELAIVHPWPLILLRKLIGDAA